MKPARHPQQLAQPQGERLRKLETGVTLPLPVATSPGASGVASGAGAYGTASGGDTAYLENGVTLGSTLGDRVITQPGGSMTDITLPASAAGTWDMWTFIVNQTITADAADLVGQSSVVVIMQAGGFDAKLLLPVDPIYGVHWERTFSMVYPVTEGPPDFEFAVASAVRDPIETLYFHHTYATLLSVMYVGTLDT